MKNEIAAVVFFFTKLVRKNDKLGKEAVERFAEKLTVILQEKYKNHWYPEKPSKGQAYRCIRVNRFQRVDPDVLKACEHSRILYSDLDLPRELTLWVDPCEVCCSFKSGDENKDEISKKVTSAVDKVTSDYHSGSSSDEEGCKETKPVLAAGRPARASESAIRPMAPWSPLPRRNLVTSYRGFGSQGSHLPPFPLGYPHPGKRSQAYHPGLWAPPALRGEPRPFWPSPQMPAPPPQ
ncbi:protein BTG3 isoform X2 [Tachyglossus aculeatus]|uniref:protein BTG3 isoform X2 n=1 Tax=Tachyglossus aculeatus TaxID=9261 RepID=UPI0018F5B6ED|nr:protein BTG3 isoform X2 [Tachyglossus aculeatus]